jgi:hypothetical protein
VLCYRLGPLASAEIGAEFQVRKAMEVGTLPEPYLEPDRPTSEKLLASYSGTYLREEIQAEAISRNLEGFSRFLTVVAACSGQSLHIPETFGQGFRFNVGAHSGVTWAHIPGTWAARTRLVLTRSKRRGDRGRQRAMPAGTVAEWNVTPCAESKKFSDCISTAT